MAHAFSIHIRCTKCETVICCPLVVSAKLPWIFQCPHCSKKFGISSESMVRQISLFIDLCTQLKKSEEILSSSSIAVNVGSSEVKLPFKLLLTRLRSTLDLEIEGSKVTISSRAEPLAIAKTLLEQETCTATL